MYVIPRYLRLLSMFKWLLLSVSTLLPLTAEDPLPSAEAVLDRNIEVTGGNSRYRNLRSQLSSGTVALSGPGMSGTISIAKAAPNLIHTVIELPVGKIEEGFDGTIAWARSPMMRPRVKQGDEKAVAQANAVFNAEVAWRDQFSKAELAGTETLGTVECYKIVLVAKDGRSQTRWYDRNAYLLRRHSMIVKSPAGEMPVETDFSDYREEGGILSAHKWVQKVMGQQITTTLTKVEYNIEFPAGRFDAPAEIRALTGK